MAFDETDDIGADIAAAFSEARGEPPAPRSDPTPSEPKVAAPEPSAASPAASRDESGRFVPKVDPETPANRVEATPAAGDMPEEIKPPASWSAQAKADFKTLPPHIQQEVLRREQDFDKGRQSFETKAQVANRIDELFASRKDQMAIQGITPLDLVQRLLAAQDILERDPRAGILALAQAYRIHPSELVNDPRAQQLAPQAQLPPQIQQLMQEVNALKGTLTQQQTLAQQAETARFQAEIQQFASDPKHLYFENVKPVMATLLRSGMAKDLADAYEQAIWRDPEIRPLLLREQQAASASAQASQSAKVSKARSAAGSVTGSPAPGATPSQRSNPNASVEDDVRAAFAAYTSRA